MGATLSFVANVVLLVFVVAVKHEERPRARTLGCADVAALAAASALIAAAPTALAWIIAIAMTLLLTALWLDATLFRVYSIELGLEGVRGIVLPALYSELAEVDFARRFLLERRAFLVLPALALLANATPLTSGASIPAVALGVGLVVVAATGPVAVRGPSWLLTAGFALLMLARALPPLPAAAMELVAAALVVAALARSVGTRSALAAFLLPRRLPESRGFIPRPEHEGLLALHARSPRRSPRHGSLSGASVVLWTFESLARDHVQTYGGLARMPRLERLLAEGAASTWHFAPCPFTNDAHLALYGSTYAPRPPMRGLRALRAAGYRSIYLTPYRTVHFGLDRILRDAGFDAIIDQPSLGGGPVPDSVLVSRGLDALERAGTGEPLFLHVHTAATHLPYRVEDRARFSRHAAEGDFGRYLDALEEADAIFGDFLDGIACRGIAREPLVVVSSDHGQSFGEMGYRSHASAIVRGQVNVPLAMHHPRLGPSTLPWSAHFDVLPTILDLLGIDDDTPCHGESLFAGEREPQLVLWAGRPARSTTSNLGVLLRDRKYMLDLALDRAWELDWNDAGREVEGAEKAYASGLVASAFTRVGLT